MDFYEAYQFLQDHPMFHGAFERALDMMVVKVDPETKCCEDDKSRNTATRIWLECGPYVAPSALAGPWSHDPRLDCGGDTFEEAIVELAHLVQTHYGDGSLPAQPEDPERAEQLQRIARMEQALCQVAEGVYGLQGALRRYTAAQSALRVLEDYYGSPLWMEDFEADENGLLPDGLLRGVLSEDEVTDLLDANDALLRQLRSLAWGRTTPLP